MSFEHLDGIKLLISIDFGTTRTGYAFAFIERIIDNSTNFEYFSKSFNSDFFKNQYKDLSDILLPDGPLDFDNVKLAQGDVLGDLNGRRAFFGFEAYERFLRKRDIDPKKALYFSRYKLDLASASSHPQSKSELGGDGRAGDECSTVDLVALILRYHGRKALEDAHNSSFASEIARHQIRWGITVPAIWDKAAIELMQEAVVRSELADDLDDVSKRFQFITEPLAATFAVLRDKRELNEYIAPGESFLIVDCGGGTIDTSVIGVSEDNEFEILDFGDGVKRGGSFLNEAIADKFWVNFPNAARYAEIDGANLDFQAGIESTKIGFGGASGQEFSTPLSPRLVTYLKATYPSEWERFSQSGKYLSPFPDSYYFELSNEEYAETEADIYSDIKVSLDRVLARLSTEPTYIFLVGGFSGSESLQKFVKENYGDYSSVVIPNRPEKAIVDGALNYTLFPERLKLRLQCSYGIEVIEPFNDRWHSRDRKFIDVTGDVFCKGCFRSFLSKGGRVPIGSRHTMERAIRFSGVWPSGLDIEEEVFMSRDGDVSYVDDDGVRAIAKLDAGSMRVVNGEFPRYEIYFEFGALITIGIINPDTGRVTKESFSPIINLMKG